MRSTGRLLVHGTPEVRKAAEQQRDFPFGARHEINNGAYLADREKTCTALRIGKKYLPASSPAQFRDASARKWRRPAHYPGNARTCRYFHDAGLHARRSTAAESRPSTISSARIAFTPLFS